MECSPSSVVQFQEESLAPFLPPLEKLTKKFKFHEHIERLGNLLLEMEEQGWNDPLSEKIEIWISSVLLGEQAIDSKEERKKFVAKKSSKLFKNVLLSFLDRAPLKSQQPRTLKEPIFMGTWTIERATLEDWISCQIALDKNLVVPEFEYHLIALAVKNWAEECLIGLGCELPDELKRSENNVALCTKRYTEKKAKKKLKKYAKLASKADLREAGRLHERDLKNSTKELVLKVKSSKEKLIAEQANLEAMKKAEKQEIGERIENLEKRFQSFEEETKAREEKEKLEKKKIQEETEALIASVQEKAHQLHELRKETLQKELKRLESTYIDEIENLNLMVDTTKEQISKIRSEHHEAIKENQTELLNNKIRLKNCEEEIGELSKKIVNLREIHSAAQSRVQSELFRSEMRYNLTLQSLESTKKVAANLQHRLNVTSATCANLQHAQNYNLAVQAHLQNQMNQLAHQSRRHRKRFGIF